MKHFVARQVKCHHYCNEPLRCPSCNKRFWQWAQQHTHGGKHDSSFYLAAAKFQEKK